MTIRYRTFNNTMLIIILSLLTITIMYTITINTLDYNVKNLDLLSIAINSDSKIELLKAANFMNNYDQTNSRLIFLKS